MNLEHMFRKIKTTFNLFATLRVNFEKLTDRESLLLSKDSFHLGSYKKLHRGKRKTNPRKKTTAGPKKEETEKYKDSVGDAVNQLANYCPLLTSSNHSFFLFPTRKCVCSARLSYSCSLERKPSNRAINRI